ncbi:MAG: hypothetical protein AAFQ45_14805 [Pseudomonadota bacterium]
MQIIDDRKVRFRMSASRHNLGWTARAATVVCAAAVAGCGVRGGLETPRSANEQPQPTATAEAGQGKPEGATRKPHQGFILDGLLR